MDAGEDCLIQRHNRDGAVEDLGVGLNACDAEGVGGGIGVEVFWWWGAGD